MIHTDAAQQRPGNPPASAPEASQQKPPRAQKQPNPGLPASQRMNSQPGDTTTTDQTAGGRANPLGAQRKAAQHSDYSNCSIHTLHTTEILQQANGGREEEARATTLCMAWHTQQETSSCAIIPTDTGRRGHPASTTSSAARGVAIRV